MNNIRDYQTLLYDFYIVAKEKGYSAAAQKYMLQQSNLSRNIQTLEKNMGLKLINSSNKGIKLTIDGERLYDNIEPIFESLSKILDKEELSGELIIGATRNISDNVLSKYISQFYQLYPKVIINIQQGTEKYLKESLDSHKIDVLFDYMPQIEYFEKKNYKVVNVYNFETCFACSQKFYDEYGKKIKNIKDLNNYNLIIPGASRRRKFLDELLQKNNISLKPIMKMPDSKLMADLVKQNNFIGYFITDEVKDYNLVKLNLQENLPRNYIGIIYNDMTCNNITKKFIELVTK